MDLVSYKVSGSAIAASVISATNPTVTTSNR